MKTCKLPSVIPATMIGRSRGTFARLLPLLLVLTLPAGVQAGTPLPPDMVLIPAGSFCMGDGLAGDSSTVPVHTNQVSMFYMDRYEVTKALWDEVQVWAHHQRLRSWQRGFGQGGESSGADGDLV